jgi:peptidoglycan/LPS O-acetylase OafA/YrhL
VGFFFPIASPALLNSISEAHLHSLAFPRIELFMGHFWTLCIEEQFYLVWPWLVFAIRDRRRLLWISITSALICPALRMFAVNSLPQSLVNSGVTCWFTPLRIDALLLGAIIALVRRGPHAEKILPLARAGFISLSLVVLGRFALNPAARPSESDYPYPAWDSTWGLSFIDVLAACLIVLAIQPDSIAYRVFRVRPLRWLGRISYGAYIFHDLPHPLYARFARHFWSHWRVGTAALAFVGTILLSSASFYWFESRFIGLKNRWSR